VCEGGGAIFVIKITFLQYFIEVRSMCVERASVKRGIGPVNHRYTSQCFKCIMQNVSALTKRDLRAL
jgi:hypothetical protein